MTRGARRTSDTPTPPKDECRELGAGFGLPASPFARSGAVHDRPVDDDVEVRQPEHRRADAAQVAECGSRMGHLVGNVLAIGIEDEAVLGQRRVLGDIAPGLADHNALAKVGRGRLASARLGHDLEESFDGRAVLERDVLEAPGGGDRVAVDGGGVGRDGGGSARGQKRGGQQHASDERAARSHRNSGPFRVRQGAMRRRPELRRAPPAGSMDRRRRPRSPFVDADSRRPSTRRRR
jgi:hypothetical protein